MRASTAAGINNSLLLWDCSCGEFACSAVWEETFFLAFVRNLPVVLYWKRPLFPDIYDIRHFWHLAFGIFGIFGIRHRRGPPGVRN